MPAKDAMCIRMVRYQFIFMEIRSRAASLVEGARDIQIPRITMGTTFSPPLLPFPKQPNVGMLTIRSVASW